MSDIVTQTGNAETPVNPAVLRYLNRELEVAEELMRPGSADPAQEIAIWAGYIGNLAGLLTGNRPGKPAVATFEE